MNSTDIMVVHCTNLIFVHAILYHSENKGSVVADKIMTDLYRERKLYLDTKRARERQCK